MRDKAKAAVPARPAAAILARLRTRFGIPAAVLALPALALALASPALAAPVHPREEARDIAGLNHSCGAAVDSKGDVYLSSAGTSEVKVYDPSHALLVSIPDSHQPCGLAVTTTGNLYVSERGTGEVVRFKPNAYPFAGTPTYGEREVIDASGQAKGIAVDPVDNRLYVAEGSRVSAYEASGSFGAHIGEGTLIEATGVAAYTYRTSNFETDRYLWVADANGVGADRLYLFGGPSFNALKLHRQLTGSTTPDGSFGFGAAGAYLAADPGNREAAGEKCVEQLGKQACTTGHLFLYDAAHKALDEFDASGEYLDQAKSAAFADAEPTAVAVDRSGGAGDGTIYLTAGAGAGAKALAFGPLKAPSRATLGEPISKVLVAVTSVATDSHGYVYATTGPKIHVYKPDGTEIKTAGKALIEDKGKPGDLAVDSTGKVYVLDENNGFSTEFEVTYLTPSAYPPVEGTTYTRHEPAIYKPEKSTILKAIAVNPGPGPGKDHLFATGFDVTHEYDSAANGSTLLNGEFAKGLSPGTRQSIAVYGQNGNVYFGENATAPLITVVSPDGKEKLARINEAGCPKGTGGFNPYVAVDQTNGHVIEFDGAKSTAREYDAAGSCVAEFGNFTEGLTKDYRVAVDSACATHEPPLTGSACEAYDPANGNAYVAFDDTNLSHPPYDVTAFGPLAYPSPPTKFKLTVEKTGTGSGKVTSSPAGIDCGSTCSAEFEEGKEVELKQEAAVGSEFSGWSGSGCSGTGTCKVTMSAAREVTAEFKLTPKPKFKLTVAKTGTGSGKVTSSPAGIDCGSTCSAEFEEGKEVELKQEAAVGSEFSGWSGSGCSGTGTCKVTMSAAREVTAEFKLTPKPKFKLTVAKTGTGSGKVTSSPAGIDCGSTCSAEFEEGKEVELKQEAAAGSEFSGWSGSGCSGTGTCKVTMSAAREVTAEFKLTPKPKFKLTVEKIGEGTVVSSPAGIDCGSTCSAEFEEGKEVELKQEAAVGSEFSGWSGSGCSGTGTCKVTMSAAREVTAEFKLTPKPKFKLTVAKTGTGSGKVTSSPAGIDCGSTCSAEFEEGKEVELKQEAAAGSEFSGWSGSGCSGTGTCKVTMSAAREVTAEFKLTPKPKFKLTVAKTGTGSGKVTSSPAGIDCGSTCSAEFEEGKEVELKQEAAAGSEFSGWSGSGCSGTGTCKVTMSAAREVTAEFKLTPKPKFKLTVEKIGEGTVVSSPAGIECGSTCSAEFEEGKEVELKQEAAAGSEFSGWSGSGCSGTGTCKVTMSAAREVTAEFKLTPKPKFKLTVEKIGEGTVVSSPAGIECGGTCDAEFEEGSTVTLTASPATGYAFSSWAGCTTHLGLTCTVEMSKAKKVKASFIKTWELTVEKTGTGAGKVMATGISCDENCPKATSAIKTGTAVTVKVTTAKGSEAAVFEGGTGSASGCSGATCIFTIEANSSVKVKFNAIPTKTLTVELTGPAKYKGKVSGKGTVKGLMSAAINCGLGCTSATESFFATDEVELIASASTGYAFKGWTVAGGSAGTCTGTTTPCKVPTNASKTVKAEFK